MKGAGDRGRFCYNPTAPADDPRMSHGRLPGTVMTSVGLLAQLYLGEDRNDRQMQRRRRPFARAPADARRGRGISSHQHARQSIA